MLLFVGPKKALLDALTNLIPRAVSGGQLGGLEEEKKEEQEEGEGQSHGREEGGGSRRRLAEGAAARRSADKTSAATLPAMISELSLQRSSETCAVRGRSNKPT